MVICYTPRPRLQPQEEVVAVVTRKKCGFQTHGQRHAAAARHIQRHPEISGLCQCEQMNWLQELLWKHRKVSQVDSICQHFLPCWYRPAFREAQEKKRATFSTAVTCYYLFYPCYDIFIRQKMSQYKRTLFHSRRQPRKQTAAEASCKYVTHTPLKCLWTLMSFSLSPSFPIIQLEMSDAADCQEVINGARINRYTCPFCTFTLHPSACHCSLTRQHELTYCLKYTLSEHSTSSLNQSCWCFILLWVRPFILLSHTPQGEIFSAGSVPVFTVSPHKAPGTLKKLAFLCIAAIICCYNPPLPAVSIFLFQGSTSSPTAVLVFVGEGRVWVRFCSLCFQKPQNKSVTWHILHH